MVETAGHLSDAKAQEPAHIPPMAQGQYHCCLRRSFWVRLSDWLASASVWLSCPILSHPSPATLRRISMAVLVTRSHRKHAPRLATSTVGTSSHFAATQHFGCFRSE